MMRTADLYKIKYILNGHNFRTEGSSPLAWTYMDARYLQSVYMKFTGRKLKMNLLTFKKQLWYVLKGIKHIRPMYYNPVNMMEEKSRLIKEYGWKDYGDKHAENIYTQFIGSYYLPVKFGIDKRVTYYSAMIRTGIIPNFKKLSDPLPPFNVNYIKLICARLGIEEALFNQIMKTPRNYFTDFGTYHHLFKKYKLLLWLGVKLNLIPYTFYKKYSS